MPRRDLVRHLPILALAVLLACSPSGEKSASGGAGPSPSPDASKVAGKIGGRDVTVGQIDDWVMDKLFSNATGNRNPTRLYELRKRALEQMAAEEALDAQAAKAHQDRETFLREEITKRANVTDDEVKAFYEAHKNRYGNRTFEQLQPILRRQLEAEKRQKAIQDYIAELRQRIGFESDLEQPRFQIAGDGPSLGPKDAPVTLVEFSDFQCPFCKATAPIVRQVLARYPTQVRFVYRNFPLDNIHPLAHEAALAALCAEDQGKFWDYERVLFDRSPKLDEADLKQYARDVGLDGASFDACLDAKKHEDTIKADVAAGETAGVSGTPAFFVDGLLVTGARTANDFEAAINAELERLKIPVPAAPAAAPPVPAAPMAAAQPAPAPPGPMSPKNASPAPPGGVNPAPAPAAAAPKPAPPPAAKPAAP
jgi:protein-disulfide isomerase